jgi:hypothetical protein
MKTVAARKRSAKKPTAKKTITVDLGLIKTFEEYFRLWSDGDEDVWNRSAAADRYRSRSFGQRMARRLALLLHQEETREAITRTLRAVRRHEAEATCREQQSTGAPMREITDPEEITRLMDNATSRHHAAAILALAELVKQHVAKVARATGADDPVVDVEVLAHLRWDLLTAAAAFYAPEVGNVERHQALKDAGLIAANDNAEGAAGRSAA